MGSTRYDDLDQTVTGDQVKEVTFSIDDTTWIIDLGPSNRQRLRDSLAEFIEVATEARDIPEPVTKATTKTSTSAQVNTGWTTKDVRAWWQANAEKTVSGIEVPKFNASGRIFDNVFRAFNAVHAPR